MPIPKCIFYPCITTKHRDNKLERCITKSSIEVANYELDNAREMSEYLQKHNNCDKYFFPIYNCSETYITEVNNDFYEQDTRIKRNDNYIAYVQKLPERQNTLYDALYNSHLSSHRLFLCYIHTLRHLLLSLSTLRELGIVIWNLHPSNIMMFRDDPYLYDFKQSFRIQFQSDDGSNNTKLMTHLQHMKCSVFLPIEAHIIRFVRNQEHFGLSKIQLEMICDDFVGPTGLGSLNIFTEPFLIEYKEKCMVSLRSILNKPNIDVVNEMMNTAETWNIYSVSVIYLLFLRDFYIRLNPKRFEENVVLNNIRKLLYTNLCSVFEKGNDERKNILRLDNILFGAGSNILKEIIQFW